MYDRDRPVLMDDSEPVSINDLYSPETALRTDNSYAEWLTNGEWDETKYTQYMFLKHLPVIGSYTDFLTDYYDDLSYMKANQVDWDDVKRPWKLRSSESGSRFIGSALNFVSDNIKKLYR